LSRGHFHQDEEEKSEQEPLRILGTLVNGEVLLEESLKISAHCNRVPVIDGNMACVSIKFAERKPSIQEIIKMGSLI
jgi:aspartate-semialdehyde dehydrogenase